MMDWWGADHPRVTLWLIIRAQGDDEVIIRRG
jgi:hypothetical protein